MKRDTAAPRPTGVNRTRKAANGEPRGKPAGRAPSPAAKTAPCQPARDPRKNPKANDVVTVGDKTRRVYNAKGGQVVFNVNGGPFDVVRVGLWRQWAEGGTVVTVGGR